MFGRKKRQKPKDFIGLLNSGLPVEEVQAQVNLHAAIVAVRDKEAETTDHENLVELRKTWGKLILGVLGITIVFNIFLVCMVGSGVWKFPDNSTFLSIVAGQNLAQVIGLVTIILRSLFK